VLVGRSDISWLFQHRDPRERGNKLNRGNARHLGWAWSEHMPSRRKCGVRRAQGACEIEAVQLFHRPVLLPPSKPLTPPASRGESWGRHCGRGGTNASSAT
jgi:hypothetical protein